MLLLWLSIACMIPFDMSRLDGTFGSGKGERRRPVVDRIIDVAKVNMEAQHLLFIVFYLSRTLGRSCSTLWKNCLLSDNYYILFSFFRYIYLSQTNPEMQLLFCYPSK